VVLFDTATLMAYCIAAIALVIAPGPGQALILARTVAGGTRAGVLTALGLEIGTLVHTLAAALGLSVILATSATAFTVVKYAGAAYLVALGSIAIWHAGRTSTVAASMPHVDSPSGSRLVVHAAVTGVLNPKVAVFFVAFLPQFVDPDRGAVLAQFVALGILLASFGFAFVTTLSAVAGRARDRLIGSPRLTTWRERVTGAVMISLGLRLAFTEQR
jgi:threonine/homoserine/homoserine lactone efflux protein